MEIKKGLNQKNIGQLIEFANSDEEVKKFTSDAKRFRDEGSFKNWLKKGRKVYSLVNENGGLVGISWFGKEGEGFTLAIRIYGEARGKGLSFEFLKETMDDFMKSREYQEAENKDWWLETSVDNLAAIKTYEKLGFQRAEMGETPEKIIFRRSHGFGS
jgi:ribosomal protein S18 acetylase RimI-like enzyme